MNQNRICPICGSEVPIDTGICRVCQADLNTLPPEVFSAAQKPLETEETIESSGSSPTEDSSAYAANPKETSPDSPIPDWMRQRLQKPTGKERSKVDFQSYEDMLFGSGSHTVQQKSVQHPLHSSTINKQHAVIDAALIPDGMNASKAQDVPESVLVDFSIHRPNRKWDDADTAKAPNPVQQSKNNRELQIHELDTPLLIEDNTLLPPTVNTEETLVDFSVHRPNKKWDDVDNNSSANNVHRSNNRDMFSHVSSNDSTLWKGIDAPLIETDLEDKSPVIDNPALAHCAAPGKADMDNFYQDQTRGNKKQRKRKPAHPLLPEQAIEKEEATKPSSSKNEQDALVPETGTLISDLIDRIDQNNAAKPEIPELTDIPVMIEDYVSNTAALNIAAPSEISSAQETPGQSDGTSQQEASTTNQQTVPDPEIPWSLFGDKEIVAQSVQEQSDAAESNSNNEPQIQKSREENFGTTFYRQKFSDLNEDNVGEFDNNSVDLETGSDSPLAAVDQIMHQFGYHVEDASGNVQESSTNSTVTDSMQQEIPSVEEPTSQEDSEIPWDLFGTGEMVIPQLPADPAYRTFSRSSIPNNSGATSYQRKMMSSVLERIIQAENEVPLRTRSSERHLSLFTRLFWAVLAIAGVLFILLSDVTDSLIITRPPLADRSQEFIQKLDAVQGEVLVVIDYTPAYGSILDGALHQLNHKLLKNNCTLRFCVTNSIVMPNASTLIHKNEKLPDELEWWPSGAISIRAHLDAGDVPENIYLITADTASIQNWGEQLYAAGGSHALHVMAPAQLEPVLATELNAGVVTSAMFRENDYETFTDGQQLHKLGRKNYAVYYLILLLILAWPCGILMEFIRNDSVSSENKEQKSASPAVLTDHSGMNKGGAALEQQL